MALQISEWMYKKISGSLHTFLLFKLTLIYKYFYNEQYNFYKFKNTKFC